MVGGALNKRQRWKDTLVLNTAFEKTDGALGLVLSEKGLTGRMIIVILEVNF